MFQVRSLELYLTASCHTMKLLNQALAKRAWTLKEMSLGVSSSHIRTDLGQVIKAVDQLKALERLDIMSWFGEDIPCSRVVQFQHLGSLRYLRLPLHCHSESFKIVAQSLVDVSRDTLRRVHTGNQDPLLTNCHVLEEAEVLGTNKLSLLVQIPTLKKLCVRCDSVLSLEALVRYLDQGQTPQDVQLLLSSRAVAKLSRHARSFGAVSSLTLSEYHHLIHGAELAKCLEFMTNLRVLRLDHAVSNMESAVERWGKKCAPKLKKLYVHGIGSGSDRWKGQLQIKRPHLAIMERLDDSDAEWWDT